MSKQNRKNKIVSQSTKDFIREGWKLEDYSLIDFIHGYIYGRFTYLYIGGGKGDHPLAKKFAPVINFFSKLFPKKEEPFEGKRPHSLTVESGTIADGYHGKAMPLESMKELVMVNQPIRVKDLEQVIPYVRARSIVLENPNHIVVLDCPCRKHKENPCLPMDVCMVVGEPFASFVIEHHPDTSRWITRDEAITILEEEDDRGHVHHAFFKDAMLGRFYAICNCCECCCGAMGAHQRGTPMLASSGYLAVVAEEVCIGCATCEDYCQFGALAIGPDVHMVVDSERCMGCGVCVSKCPEGAIALEAAPEKGIPLEIANLMAAAAGQD
ncbi:MAG: 4Fe-4S binding protein [Anaerolineales bacterium]|jgi:Pyruvate/2-oxoacid:ferredoxin oxidoreductase delta subunit